jgi:hypothetical protein
MSFSYSRSVSFTIAHARQLSSKVAADMHLCAAYYDRPSESMISHYAEELALLLRDGYVAKYEFGFKKESRRFLSWQYSVLSDGSLSFDDRAGKLLSSIDVSGASFFNYLWHSDKWWVLSQDERDKTEESLPVSRTGGNPPADGSGYWISQDRTYSAGGVGLGRATFRPFG